MRRASILSQPRRLFQRLIVALALAGTVGGAAALAAPGQPSQQQAGTFSSRRASASTSSPRGWATSA